MIRTLMIGKTLESSWKVASREEILIRTALNTTERDSTRLESVSL
jgi:hypothetical protein